MREAFCIIFLLAVVKPTAAIDDYWHYTDVGALGMTITNFGVLGQGYNIEGQPSCWYKMPPAAETEQIEHLSYGGLWVGGIKNSMSYVSTGIVDGVFEYSEGGWEFTNSADPGDTIKIRSTFRDSPYYSPDAVSQLDFVCDFTDSNLAVPGTSPPVFIPEHYPMGINVHLETYAWNYSYAEAFVILNYTIRNYSGEPIDSVHIGLWIDESPANMNYTDKYAPGGGGFTWYDNLVSYDPIRRMSYAFDADGDDGWTKSYLGIRPLGVENQDGAVNDWEVFHRQWVWNRATSLEYPDFVMPTDDGQRFENMSSQYIGIIPDSVSDADSWMVLNCVGSLGTLEPCDWDADTTDGDFPNFEAGDIDCDGDSLFDEYHLTVVYAVICGLWATGGDDSEARRENLNLNAEWAMTTYLNDYQLPEPPPSPALKIIPGESRVDLYWNNSPESFIDPISGAADFEGYRIYGARKTYYGEDPFTLLLELDRDDDNIGFNTGFSMVEYDTIIEGFQYDYHFADIGVPNGWPGRLMYSVTAFDQGDPQNNLESLESAVNENLVYAYAGARTAEETGRKVSVYPNPYRGRAAWDGFSETERLIYFQNLPSDCEVRIFTLAGDLVDKFEHHASTYDGSDVASLAPSLSGMQVEFSGGQHGWDLITMHQEAIASGLYLFTVKDLNNGEVQVGKFLIIK
ncbi:MAG: hypothetical protein HQ591_08685 [candidate division Zixibacteria bacterium]|nr:hypothetical protein [Candidatus Tariuqbacter arcticus]